MSGYFQTIVNAMYANIAQEIAKHGHSGAYGTVEEVVENMTATELLEALCLAELELQEC